MSFIAHRSHPALRTMLIIYFATVLALLTGAAHAQPADLYMQATAGHNPLIQPSYFGTHFHRLVLNTGEKHLLTRWPSSHIGALRLWDSGALWSEIAIYPGQWKYDRIDSYVKQATAHKARLLYTLGGTPRWASARPDEKCSYGLGCAAEPVKMAHWEEYVRRVAQRYRGQISAYELWNEPKFSDLSRDRHAASFFTGSVAQMVEMARIARKVLDEIDPNALLATPGFVNGPDRLELFLAAGGKHYVQAIAYHFYARNTEALARQLIEVRSILLRQGLDNLPLWNTETGVIANLPDSLEPKGTKPKSPLAAAYQLGQFLVFGGAAGLEHFYHYAWDNPYTGMISQSGERLPSQDGYEKVQSWLVGSRMLGCKKIMPEGVVCEGERVGSRFAIAWSDRGGAYPLPIPAGMRVLGLSSLLSTEPLSAQSRGRMVLLALGPEPVHIQFGTSP